MTNNILEFKEFMDYFNNVINQNTNEFIKIKIYYKNDNLVIESENENGKAIDCFKCSEDNYYKLIEILNLKFIFENDVKFAVKRGKNYTIKSKNDEVTTAINEELFENLSSKIYSKKNTNLEGNKKPNEFEKFCFFYNDIELFIKRCLRHNGINNINITYVNNIFQIKITNNDEVIFQKHIKCNETKAIYLFKIICENIIDSNSIILSSINQTTNGNKVIKIQTPKLNLTIPYINSLKKFHIEALNKMNEYDMKSQKQKIKSSSR